MKGPSIAAVRDESQWANRAYALPETSESDSERTEVAALEDLRSCVVILSFVCVRVCACVCVCVCQNSCLLKP